MNKKFTHKELTHLFEANGYAYEDMYNLMEDVISTTKSYLLVL